MAQAADEAAFLEAFAGYSPAVEAWRPTEFPSLVHGPGKYSILNSHSQITQAPTTANLGKCEAEDLERLVYVDHAGATLAGEAQLRAAFDLVSGKTSIAASGSSFSGRSSVGLPLGSPHSQGPAASRTVEAIETVRARTLRLFGCTEQTHTLIFTSGATAAARLVADHFPWQQGSSATGSGGTKGGFKNSSREPNDTNTKKETAPGNAIQRNRRRNRSVFAHSLDCHTSCLGVRAVALNRGAEVACLPRHVTALPFPTSRPNSEPECATYSDGADEEIVDKDARLSESTSNWLLSWPAHGGGPPDAPPGMVYDAHGPTSSCTSANGSAIRYGIDREDASTTSAPKASGLASASGTEATRPKGTVPRWLLKSNLWQQFCKLHIAVAGIAVLPVIANIVWTGCYLGNSFDFTFINVDVLGLSGQKHQWLLLAFLIFVMMFISFAVMSVVFDDSKDDDSADRSSDSKFGSKITSTGHSSSSKAAKSQKRTNNKGFAPLGLGICFPLLELNSSDSESTSSSEDDDGAMAKNNNGSRCTGNPDSNNIDRKEGDVGHNEHGSGSESAGPPAACLICYPLESNFDGVRHVAKLPTILRNARQSRDREMKETASSSSSKTSGGRRWWTLVDAAKFVGTSSLQLGASVSAANTAAVCCEADFVIVSFYKLFGYPTGLGALIMRNEAAQLLTKYGQCNHESGSNDREGRGNNSNNHSSSSSKHKAPPLCEKYFGGGSLAAALAGAPWERFRADPASRFSDGTQHFLGIVALCAGLDRLESGAWNREMSIEEDNSNYSTSCNDSSLNGRSSSYFSNFSSSPTSSLLKSFHFRQSSGMSRVASHVAACGHRLAAQLYALRHPNGRPVVELYGHWPSIAKRAESIFFAQAMEHDACKRIEESEDGNDDHRQENTDSVMCERKKKEEGMTQNKSSTALWWQSWAAAVAAGKGARQVQGPVVTFSVLRPDGSMVGYAEVQAMAALHKPPIQLRAGCFCNPGACQAALGLSDEAVVSQHLDGGHACGDSHDMVDGLPTGAVRCSLGWCSTRADVDAVVAFLGSAFCNGIAPAIDDALAWALNNATPSSSSLSNSEAAVENGMKSPAAESQPLSSLTIPSPTPSPPLILQELWVYPVKSCAGLRVKQWPVAMHGTSGAASDDTHSAEPSSKFGAESLSSSKACLLLDRAFVVVDARSRLPLRARQYPLLAHCFPSIDLAAGTVTIRAAGMPDLFLEAGVRVARPPHKETTTRDDPGDVHSSVKKDDVGENEFQQYAHLDATEEDSCGSNDIGPSEAVAVCSKKQTIGVPSKSALYAITKDLKGENAGTDQSVDDSTISGDSASAWFSTLLGIPAALLRASDLPTSREKKGSNRDASIAPRSDTMIDSSPQSPSSKASASVPSSRDQEAAAAAVSTTFSNEAPFLLISSRSVALLNQAMNRALAQNSKEILGAKQQQQEQGLGTDGESAKETAEHEEQQPEVELVTARNFRPNLVVGSNFGSGDDDGFATTHNSQVDAHAEDQWASLAIGCSTYSRSFEKSDKQPNSSADHKATDQEDDIGHVQDNEDSNGKSYKSSDTRRRKSSSRGVRFVALGDCARCAMVDVHYPKSLEDNSTNGDGVSSSSSMTSTTSSSEKAQQQQQHRSSALRTLASYRRRHAQIVFGRYLAALPPALPKISPEEAPTEPLGAAADSIPKTRKVPLQWIAEGDEIEPLSYCD